MHPPARQPDPDALHAIAGALLGYDVQEVTRAGNGGNSRIYRVTADGKSYALKIYPAIAGDMRDRLGVEKKALQLLARQGIACVPRWINDCPGHALLSWVEGDLANPPLPAEIDTATDFLGKVKRLSDTPEATGLPAASEACVSGAEVIRQMERRLADLRKAAYNEPMLENFLTHAFAPAFAEAQAKARELYRASALDFDAPMEHGRCLIPADFGFHNALRAPDGGLTFIDFEYFGWDDPAKLTADFLLHPAMQLGDALEERFRANMLTIHKGDPHFRARLQALTPLFALRWVLILLNEFLPERWRARALAQGESAWAEAKERQMKKALMMLEKAQSAQ